MIYSSRVSVSVQRPLTLLAGRGPRGALLLTVHHLPARLIRRRGLRGGVLPVHGARPRRGLGRVAAAVLGHEGVVDLEVAAHLAIIQTDVRPAGGGVASAS